MVEQRNRIVAPKPRSLRAEVLFGVPRQEIASRLVQLIKNSKKVHLVTGFMTEAGTSLLREAIASKPDIVEGVVVGAGTDRAFDALEGLIGVGVKAAALRVHLGHSRPTSDGKYPFIRYHPMMHSKVYLFEHYDGTSSAIVGSHNLTGFALIGLNSEASVLLTGQTDDLEMVKIRRHVDSCFAEAVPYDPTKRTGYAWWFQEFLKGLSTEVARRDDDIENRRTLIVLCQGDLAPSPSQIVYFAVPEELKKFVVNQECHGFVFRKLPATPKDAITKLDQAIGSFWATIKGVEMDGGGIELEADWEIEGTIPQLRAVTPPFRPERRKGEHQLRVLVQGSVRNKYEYLFTHPQGSWEPTFDNSETLDVSVDYKEINAEMLMVPSGWFQREFPWTKVKDVEEKPDAIERTIGRVASPEGSSFSLFSLARKNRSV